MSTASMKQQGFTLVELLISIAILGILMLAFTQVFGGSLRASSDINVRSELINEGQVAQKIVASRLQGASYIYPTGTTISLTTAHATTRNTVRSGAGQNWIVGTDPFVAMLLPPRQAGVCSTTNQASCYEFYAYYPINRGQLVSGSPLSAPNADPNNTGVWVLMEYSSSVIDNIDRSRDPLATPPLTSTAYRGRVGRVLVDYVQPLTTAAPYNRMFAVDTTNGFVDFDLRFLLNRRGEQFVAPAVGTTLSTRVYPRNWD